MPSSPSSDRSGLVTLSSPTLLFAAAAAVAVIVILGLTANLSFQGDEWASIILAIGRAHFGPDQALAPRYIYVAFPFILMTLTGLRGIRREVWGLAFVLSLTLNVWALPRGVAIYQAFLTYDRSIPLEERLAPFR